MKEKIGIAAGISFLRKEKNLNVNQLASLTGTSPKRIQDFEKGKEIDLRTIYLVGRILFGSAGLTANPTSFCKIEQESNLLNGLKTLPSNEAVELLRFALSVERDRQKEEAKIKAEEDWNKLVGK